MRNKNIFSCGLLIMILIYPLLSQASDPFAGLPDPTHYKKNTPKKVVKKIIRKPLTLQSTLISEDSSYAIINGKQIAIGGRIEGAKLLSINPFDVVVEQNGKTITLELLSTDVMRQNARMTNED